MSRPRLAILLALLVAFSAVFSVPLLAAAMSTPATSDGSNLDTSKIPADLVPLIQAAAGTCPEITAPLLAAQEDAESGFRADAVGPPTADGQRAQGIAQFMPGTWQEYGGDGNGDGKADPFDPADAIPAQARLMCDLAHQVQTEVQAAHLSGDVVDLTLASYNAGFGAVQTYHGVPPYPETVAYIARIRRLQTEYTAAAPIAAGPSPDGSWPAEACSVIPDPTTGRGCLTPRTAALVTQLRAAGYQRISCWDPHLQNPSSDHPKGRACDVTIGPGGVLPTPAQKATGDQLTAQLQQLAASLGINYLIWYGHIWSVARADEGCRPYNGGGVYNPTDITGGHYDHVHVSIY